MDTTKIFGLVGSLILFLFGLYVLYNGYNYINEHPSVGLVKYIPINIGGFLCLISVAFIILTFSNVLDDTVYNAEKQCDDKVNEVKKYYTDAYIPKKVDFRKILGSNIFAIRLNNGMCVSDNGTSYENKQCDEKDMSLYYTTDENSQIINYKTGNCISEDPSNRDAFKSLICKKSKDQTFNRYDWPMTSYGAINSVLINANGNHISSWLGSNQPFKDKYDINNSIDNRTCRSKVTIIPTSPP